MQMVRSGSHLSAGQGRAGQGRAGRIQGHVPCSTPFSILPGGLLKPRVLPQTHWVGECRAITLGCIGVAGAPAPAPTATAAVALWRLQQ